jgi:DNA repair exonuclease SbcCD ATPase subunit
VEVALILVSVAFLVTLGLLVMGRQATHAPSAPVVDDGKVKQLEAELDRRRKEMDEQRRQLGDAREELKLTKRKLFEQKEALKEDRDLARARVEVERSASVQLEMVREELGHALAEVERLKREAGRPARPRTPEPHPPPAAAAALAPVVPSEPEKPRKVIRELSDADKQRMERLEHEARKERQRAAELEKEIKRLKTRGETQSRVYMVTKGELDLFKDKFKALEKRMNRTLLENDLLRRAIRDLEKKTGIAAARTELTAEEVAASDRQVEEQVNAEAAREAKRHAERVRAAESDGEAPGDAASVGNGSPPRTGEPH